MAKCEKKITEIASIEKKSAFDWKYQKAGLIVELSYAIGLVIAFSLMCSFFFPPAMLAPALVLILAAAGAALSFVLTVAFSAATGGLEIAKTKATAAQIKEEYKQLLNDFKSTQIQWSETENPEEQTRLEHLLRTQYIMLKDLEADAGYHQRMVGFQAAKLVRSIFIDAMIPPLIFASLVFMPLGIGIGVIVAGLALAVLSSLILNRFAPKAATKYELAEDESDFKAFCKDPDGYAATFAGGHGQTPGFFTPVSSKEGIVDEDSVVDLSESEGHPLLQTENIILHPNPTSK